MEWGGSPPPSLILSTPQDLVTRFLGLVSSPVRWGGAFFLGKKNCVRLHECAFILNYIIGFFLSRCPYIPSYAVKYSPIVSHFVTVYCCNI